MGYELNKLLEHYGLSSPTIANYGGSTETEKGAYDSYVNAYKDRIKNVSMYGQGATDKIAPPTYSTPVSPVSAPTTSTPVAPAITPTANTSTSAPVALSIPQTIAANTLPSGSAPSGIFGINNTLTSSSPLLFKGPVPLFSGMWGLNRAKGGAIDVMAEKYKFAKKHNYADGGGVSDENAIAVDPITLNYSLQPDIMAPIKPEISAGQAPAPSGPDELAYFYNDAYAPTPEVSIPQEPSAAVSKASASEVPKASAPKSKHEIMAQMLKQYGPEDMGYRNQIEEAQRKYNAETEAFTKMLQGSIDSPEQSNLSKAELYFRLAAAFGSPTKTKQGFLENLGSAGKELSEYSKGQREAELSKAQLRIKGQEIKHQAARQELTDLRTLASEEMKDKRALGLKFIEEYVKSGEAKSTAGKQAQDEGFKPGTPEFQERTAAIANITVEKMLSQMQLNQQQMQLLMANFGLKKESAGRLTQPEMKMKLESEKNIESYTQVMKDLDRAYRLNPNSLASGWVEKGQAWLESARGSNDPIFLNTRELNNLLGSQALEKLRATFGGNPTEGERAILIELQGIGAKSREERARIIMRAYQAVKERHKNELNRLNRINSREFATSETSEKAE